MFCKYLHNGSSDPYEILYGGQLLSCDLNYQISCRSVHKCVRTSCKHARACFIASVRVYESCARICSGIFMKFKTFFHKIVTDPHIKFHKYLSFCSGDICKQYLLSENIDFLCIFHIFTVSHLKSHTRCIITEWLWIFLETRCQNVSCLYRPIQ